MSSFTLPWGWGKEVADFSQGLWGWNRDLQTDNSVDLSGRSILTSDQKSNSEKERCCDGSPSCVDITGSSSCLCYCAVKCGLRPKTPADQPIFLSPKNDPFKKSCYCAPRDLNLLNKDEQRCENLEKSRG